MSEKSNKNQKTPSSVPNQGSKTLNEGLIKGGTFDGVRSGYVSNTMPSPGKPGGNDGSNKQGK